MKRLFLASAIGLLSAVGSVPSAHAAVELTASQQSVVHNIEDTLAHAETFRARFEQHADTDGKTVRGTVIVARPGRMRFTYDPPSPLSIVANEGRVVFQDVSIDQTTTLPLGRTPLGLLLRPDPHFSGDVTVTDFQQTKNHIQLKAVRTDNPNDGELTLLFKAHPLALQGWSVVDAQGRHTSIRLLSIRTGVKIYPKDFELPKEE